MFGFTGGGLQVRGQDSSFTSYRLTLMDYCLCRNSFTSYCLMMIDYCYWAKFIYVWVCVPQMLDYCQLLSSSLLLKNCSCYCASMCQTEMKMRLWFDVWRLLGLASWIFITSLNCPCIPGPGRVAPLLQLPSALTFSDQSEQPLSSGPSERVMTLEESMRQLERGIQSGTLCFHFEVFNTQTGAKNKKFMIIIYLF